MDRLGFGAEATGTLVPTIGGRRAFVPAPLPPVLNLDIVLPALMRATQAVGELKGIGRTVANPLLLIRPLQRREAVSSSGMEGTYTTLTDLFLFEAGGEEATTRGDTREVANYVQALEGAIDALARLPISTRLIRDAHRVLLSDVARHRGATVRAGELKRDQNWIGGGGRIDDARFIPAPPADTPEALDRLFGYVHRAAPAAPLIDAALAHYQFEAIHPFADGNGRVGRMLITLMLVDNGTLPQPLLYMSPWLERHKDRYIDLMYAVSREGAWEAWITFFLDAVAASAGETIAVVERLQDLQQTYRERFQTARRSALMLRIIDLAFERPVRSITNIADALGVTYAGAANNVNELIAQGVAEEVAGSYPKLIRFPGVVAALGGVKETSAHDCSVLFCFQRLARKITHPTKSNSFEKLDCRSSTFGVAKAKHTDCNQRNDYEKPYYVGNSVISATKYATNCPQLVLPDFQIVVVITFAFSSANNCSSR